MLAHAVADVGARLEEILDALHLLVRHPLIGRPSDNGLRELVIGQGARGYVALYSFNEFDDEVVVLALRAQREAGFGGAGGELT
jgi:toxin ParE1/3/4